MIRLGPFDLIEIVGKGGMGEAWRGIHREQQVPVAVKVLTSERARHLEYRLYFRNEVRSVARLNHPHVVMVFDHGEIEPEIQAASDGRIAAGSPFLVMEWASRGTLSKRPPMAWPQLRGVLLCLLDALAHSHARGVIHRDLKPGNILLCDDDDQRPGLKLADFGIARPREVESDALVVGTPSYMAPEQAAGSWRDQGPWTDLYGLGCLVYRLLTGSPPFPNTDTKSAAHSHLYVNPPPLQPVYPVPRGFHGWLAQLLEKDPSRRFRRAADAVHALLQIQAPVIGGTADAPLWPGSEAETIHRTVTLGPTQGLWAAADSPTAATIEEERAEPGDGNGAVLVSAGPSSAPPLPETWRRPESYPTSLRLVGVGLGLYGLRSIPMVDREVERDALWEVLRESRAENRARLVVLHGPGGCGKSRLAEWLCERAHEVGSAEVLRAVHGPTRDYNDGLGPMLARQLRCSGLPRPAVVRRIHATLCAQQVTEPNEWHALTEAILPAPEGDQSERIIRFGSARERYVVIRRHLERLCVERPLILWLDDVQWGADALAFAADLLDAQSRSPSPVLLVLTVGEEALAERPAESVLLDELLVRPGTLRLSVGPLAPNDRPALVRELLGIEGELAVQVEKRTAGSPLFAVQLLGEWVQRGLLELGEHGFRLKAGAKVELPDDLHQVWAARVEQLLAGRPASEGTALALAAVLGQRVDAAEWREVCARAGVLPSPLLVEALIARRLAVASEGRGDTSWSFVHGMLRESLERRAGDAGRLRRFHRCCAEMLRERGGTNVAERFGRHLVAAGEHEEALAPLLAGADERVVFGDYRGAENLLTERETAMREIGLPADDRCWGEGWILRCLVLRIWGRWDEAHDWAARAERAAKEHGWEQMRAHALLEQGRVSVARGAHRRAWRRLRKAERIATALGENRLLGEARRAMAEVMVERASLDESAALYRQAMSHFAALDEHRPSDVMSIAQCLRGLGEVARQAGQMSSAAGYLKGSRAAFEQAGSRWGLANALNSLADLERLRGHLDEAEAGYRSAMSLYEALDVQLNGVLHANIGLVMVARRRYAEGRRIFEEALASLEAIDLPPLVGTVHACILPCLVAEKDWVAWRDHLAAAERILEETARIDLDIAAAAQLAGDMAREAGEPDRAREAYRLALAQWRALDRNADGDRVEAALAAL